MLLTRLENKTTSSTTTRSASLAKPSGEVKDGREKAGHPQSHPAQELAGSQRKVYNNCCRNILSHYCHRYGYGGWVSLDHTCGGSPKPGKANMMKVKIILILIFVLIINVIICVFRMEISSGRWRRTVGAQRYYLHMSLR